MNLSHVTDRALRDILSDVARTPGPADCPMGAILGVANALEGDE